MLAMLLRKLAMLSRVSKVIQKDNRRSEILKGLIQILLLFYYLFRMIKVNLRPREKMLNIPSLIKIKS